MILFLQKYWKILLGLFFVLGVIIQGEIRVHKIQNELKVVMETSNNEINTLKTTNEAEIKKKDELIEQHQQEIQAIENRYIEQAKELETEKSKKIKVIVQYINNDPEKLSSKIIETWGFTREK